MSKKKTDVFIFHSILSHKAIQESNNDPYIEYIQVKIYMSFASRWHSVSSLHGVNQLTIHCVWTFTFPLLIKYLYVTYML